MMIKVGASTFLNTAPLIYGLKSLKNVSLVRAAPSRLPLLLQRRKVDIAVIPSAALFLNDNLSMITKIGIASYGDVKSVVLRTFRRIKEIKIVREDKSSVTSNILARILFKKYFQIDPLICTNGRFDAEVIIGDRSFIKDKDAYKDFDLSRVWKDITGLPFVFAVWAKRSDDENSELYKEFIENSLSIGMSRLQEISRDYSKRLGLSERFCLYYLKKNIHFKLEEEDFKAMKLLNSFMEEIGYIR